MLAMHLLCCTALEDIDMDRVSGNDVCLREVAQSFDAQSAACIEVALPYKTRRNLRFVLKHVVPCYSLVTDCQEEELSAARVDAPGRRITMYVFVGGASPHLTHGYEDGDSSGENAENMCANSQVRQARCSGPRIQ